MRDDEKKRPCSIFIHAGNLFREPAWRPRADVYSTPDGWIIKLDVAGVRRQDLELQVEDGRVVVRGIRRDFVIEEGSRSQLMEIPYSRFERVIDVPCRDTSEIEVSFEEGMLLVRIHSENRSR